MCIRESCCCYHKGRNFQANHNRAVGQLHANYRCCCYHKGRNFQANHNRGLGYCLDPLVVVATTKVGIFKQITTSTSRSPLSASCCCYHKGRNFQANHNCACERFATLLCCCCYHKGRNFQANHNGYSSGIYDTLVVVATTKVGIFKQITTTPRTIVLFKKLLLLPQRQEFSSKSQPVHVTFLFLIRCCCYHKGRNFQANHNLLSARLLFLQVVVATTKVGIFKQITTRMRHL